MNFSQVSQKSISPIGSKSVFLILIVIATLFLLLVQESFRVSFLLYDHLRPYYYVSFLACVVLLFGTFSYRRKQLKRKGYPLPSIFILAVGSALFGWALWRALFLSLIHI